MIAQEKGGNSKSGVDQREMQRLLGGLLKPSGIGKQRDFEREFFNSTREFLQCTYIHALQDLPEHEQQQINEALDTPEKINQCCIQSFRWLMEAQTSKTMSTPSDELPNEFRVHRDVNWHDARPLVKSILVLKEILGSLNVEDRINLLGALRQKKGIPTLANKFVEYLKEKSKSMEKPL
ncbi:hypothetical protein ACFLRC_01090 [Candidatus Altiarchaeota archaeon]